MFVVWCVMVVHSRKWRSVRVRSCGKAEGSLIRPPDDASVHAARAPRSWPGRELARRLDVSARTRDIDRLRALPYSVASDGGVGSFARAAVDEHPGMTDQRVSASRRIKAS